MTSDRLLSLWVLLSVSACGAEPVGTPSLDVDGAAPSRAPDSGAVGAPVSSPRPVPRAVDEAGSAVSQQPDTAQPPPDFPGAAPLPAGLALDILYAMDEPAGSVGDATSAELEETVPYYGGGVATFRIPFTGPDEQLAWDYAVSPPRDGRDEALVIRIRRISGFNPEHTPGRVRLVASSGTATLENWAYVVDHGWVDYSLDLESPGEGFDASAVERVGFVIDTGTETESVQPAVFEVDLVGFLRQPDPLEQRLSDAGVAFEPDDPVAVDAASFRSEPDAAHPLLDQTEAGSSDPASSLGAGVSENVPATEAAAPPPRSMDASRPSPPVEAGGGVSDAGSGAADAGGSAADAALGPGNQRREQDQPVERGGLRSR